MVVVNLKKLGLGFKLKKKKKKKGGVDCQVLTLFKIINKNHCLLFDMLEISIELPI